MIPAGSLVLLRTGWGQRWPNAADYMGIPLDQRNSTDLNVIADPDQPYRFAIDLAAGSVLNFPGISHIHSLFCSVNINKVYNA